MPTMNRASRTSASASWPSWTFGIAPPEPRLDHHLLAVVGPALDVRRRREQGRATDLRLHLPEVLEVEEVAGEHLVHRDAPQRRVVQVAQVLALALLGPAAQRVGQVVGRAGRLGLERAGHPQARRRPAQEPRTGRHLHVLAVGHVEHAAAGQERPAVRPPARGRWQSASRARDASPWRCATPRPGRRCRAVRPACGRPPGCAPARARRSASSRSLEWDSPSSSSSLRSNRSRPSLNDALARGRISVSSHWA